MHRLEFPGDEQRRLIGVVRALGPGGRRAERLDRFRAHGLARLPLDEQDVAVTMLDRQPAIVQIGRATGWARVCQYAAHSVCAGPLTKDTTVCHTDSHRPAEPLVT